MHILIIKCIFYFIYFRSTENLLHRLFVCIAGVADQLQTNFASDLRQILRSVFLMNVTPPQEEIDVPEKTKDTDFFEFRASEQDVIADNAGSNQSIYSAEEVSPEPDCVFDDRNSNLNNDIRRQERSASLETENRCIRNGIQSERSHSLGEEDSAGSDDSNNYHTGNVGGKQRSNSVRERNHCNASSTIKDMRTTRSGDNSPVSNTIVNNSPIIQTCQTRDRNETTTSSTSSASSASSASSTQRHHNCPIISHTTEVPPRWIPDDEAPRCMACGQSFTTFRRRHHCRNCGGVFCGVCSNASAPLPKFGLIKAVRVCRNCYLREVGT